MIPVFIHTNGDKLRQVRWPESLCCKPEIGEYISSVDGAHSRKIVRIEHRTGRKYTTEPTEHYPYLGIELQTLPQDIAK